MSECGGLRHTALLVLLLYVCDGKLIEMAMSADHEDLMNKTYDFINGLKRDLRKNNDDYAELRAATDRPTDKLENDKYYQEKVTKHGLVNKNIINDDNKDAARRFGNPDNQDESTTTMYPTMRNNENRTPTKKKKPKKPMNKQEKLQKFLQKNEGLIRDFLSSRSTSSTRSTSSSTPLPVTIQPSLSLTSEITTSGLNRILSTKDMKSNSPSAPVSSSLSSSSEAQEGKALRQLELDEFKWDSDRIIEMKPEELDMMPATGARMHNLRIKGRLCQRSVLFPEGPKYDSEGKAYLRAHSDSKVANRDFANTRRPRYILPRCCNCCKKSVLGCE